MRGNYWLAPCLLGAAFFAIAVGFQPADASPQLMDVATAQGIAPKLDTGNLPGGKKAIGQAKNIQAQTKEQAKSADQLLSDKSPLPSKVWKAEDFAKEYSKDPVSGAEKMQGQIIQATGVVIGVDRDGGVTVVTLAPKNAKQSSPFFMFRFNSANVNFALGDEATLEGIFVTQVAGQKGGNDIYACEALAKDSIVATPGAAPTEPPPPFNGWRFTGSVSDMAGSTGVFVRGAETIYAQAGDVLPGDVRIAKIGIGEATLIEKGTKSLVLAW
ncbi:hypothetical protein QPK87_32065 [Kamptonema cortianum]|nr:hypothetical protein [Geitlerinema splendidum]MDK3161160.1 hypothetical protein [Kamptonema cortianum]